MPFYNFDFYKLETYFVAETKFTDNSKFWQKAYKKNATNRFGENNLLLVNKIGLQYFYKKKKKSLINNNQFIKRTKHSGKSEKYLKN